MGYNRKCPRAIMEHACFADCGVPIPAGEYYIQDSRTEGVGTQVRTVATVRWHMEHAPRTREVMIACLHAAPELKAGAKT